jgi:hypothetical protein
VIGLYRWLDKLRAQRDLAAYDRGWCWAAGALLRGNDIDWVQNKIDDGVLYDHTAFDDGAAAAVRAWERGVALGVNFERRA